MLRPRDRSPRTVRFVACVLVAVGAARLHAQVPISAQAQAARAQMVRDSTRKALAAAAAAQQPQPVTWLPPAPCTGDSIIVHPMAANRPSVPRVTGLAVDTARLRLLKLGFQVDLRTAPGVKQPGIVESQAPTALSSASRRDVIILCSWIPSRIPLVLRLTLAAARRVLRDSGYAAVRVDTIVADSAEIGLVLRQQPMAGVIVPLKSTDTLLVGVRAPPPPTRAMPDLRGMSYLEAVSALQPLLTFSNNQLVVTWRSDTGGSYRTPGSIVVRQDSLPGRPVRATDSIVVTLRDTTSQAPPAPVMPDVRGTYLDAMDSIVRLRRTTKFPLRATTFGAVVDGETRSRLIVTTQRPIQGTPLSAQTAVTMGVRDPAPPLTPMPDIRGGYESALVSLTRLRNETQFPLVLETTGAAVTPDVRSSLVVIAQSPPVGTGLTPQTSVLLTLQDSTTLVSVPAAIGTPTKPVVPVRRRKWPWVLAAIVLVLAGGAAAYIRTGRARVARMQVVPHVDAAPPRVKLAMRPEETADDAFLRIGLSFTPQVDRGGHVFTRVTLPSHIPGHDNG